MKILIVECSVHIIYRRGTHNKNLNSVHETYLITLSTFLVVGCVCKFNWVFSILHGVNKFYKSFIRLHKTIGHISVHWRKLLK